DLPKLLTLRTSEGVIEIKNYNSKAEIFTNRFFLRVNILIEYLPDRIKLINSINLIINSELVIKGDV
ncbi:hypothetical protein NEUTE1DRAFT_47595, partial [Neurospora tetrasperma FGSC 2508]